MALLDTLKDDVKGIFAGEWEVRDGRVVPDVNSVTFGNDAVKIEGAVLYADLSDSTVLVDGYVPWFAAQIYKTFLNCAAKIIREWSGEITAYDGDRVMAVFTGESKEINAVRAGFQICWAVRHIINPGIASAYPNTAYRVDHVVGVDASTLHVAKTGIRNANDLVWVGRAANYAAKMAALPHTHQMRITEAVKSKLRPSEIIDSQGDEAWEGVEWTQMNKMTIYRSSHELRIN
jgi:class 3 adenylate cyclase